MRCPSCMCVPICAMNRPFDLSQFTQDNRSNLNSGNQIERILNKKCSQCCRYFRSEDCLKNHLNNIDEESKMTICVRFNWNVKKIWKKIYSLMYQTYWSVRKFVIYVSIKMIKNSIAKIADREKKYSKEQIVWRIS